MPPPQAPFKTFETVNFYTGGTLNRLSWLRTDAGFLNALVRAPQTRFVVMQNLNALTHKGGEDEGYLAPLTWEQVKPHVLDAVRSSGHGGQAAQSLPLSHPEDLFGPAAFGIHAPESLSDAQKEAFEKSTASMGATGICLVFLGIDETGQAVHSLPGQLATSDVSASGGDHALPAGTPYFALSLTYKSKDLPARSDPPLKKLEDELLSTGKYDFVDTRALSRAGDWPMKDAALVAQARTLVDWNERNHFCPSCSRRQYSVWGGYKRSCTSALTQLLVPASNATATAAAAAAAAAYTDSLTALHLRGEAGAGVDAGFGECPSTTTLSNFSYPRTDPVVIMGVLSPDGTRLLLGRQKKWPPGFWSCLAGFIEPGESLEESVRREVLEEAGVPVSTVVYHSSQAWPFPCQLMQGCFGIAAGEGAELPEVRTDLDNELEAARWFTREEIMAVLDKSAKSHFSKGDLNKIDTAQNDPARPKAPPEQKDPGSIANTTSNDANGSGRALPASLPDNFKIPPATAIAHVLIAAWARNEAILPSVKTPQPQHSPTSEATRSRV